jgi:Icc protein
MVDRVSVEPINKDSVSVLQISDMHLFAQDHEKLLGIDTAFSFQNVIDAVKAQKREIDLVLATGDISQDYSKDSYRRFAFLVKQLDKPVFWLPGNHDDGPLMRRVMPEFGLSNARNVICGSWQFILLNTQVYSVPHGWILPDQLEYTRKCLEDNPDLNAVVCLHHNTFPVNSAWLDQHELKNKDELLDLVYNHSQVKLVLCGHVHQEHDFIKNSVRFISTPSTSIQFEPLSFNFGLDAQGPGWRYLKLSNKGDIDTQVYRLPFEKYIPDFAIGGY